MFFKISLTKFSVENLPLVPAKWIILVLVARLTNLWPIVVWLKWKLWDGAVTVNVVYTRINDVLHVKSSTILIVSNDIEPLISLNYDDGLLVVNVTNAVLNE